jgi:hypothetical protein
MLTQNPPRNLIIKQIKRTSQHDFNNFRTEKICSNQVQASPHPYPSTNSVSVVYRGPKKNLENWKSKGFISFKTPAKRERAVTWWNLAAQTCLVDYSSSFAPVLTLPRRTCHHSASSVVAVRISCRVFTVFVFRKHLFINLTLPYLCLLHEYHVMHSIRYYPRFVVTAVGLGTYYPWIRGHACI